MKSIIAIVTVTFLLISFNSNAQSTWLTNSSKLLRIDQYKDGWELLDEGSYDINIDRVLIFDERAYEQDKEYLLIALIDDCKNCPISVRFGKKGQTPNKLKDLDAKIYRFPNDASSTLYYKIRPGTNTTGYLMVYSTSSIKRYAYAMLFVRDK